MLNMIALHNPLCYTVLSHDWLDGARALFKQFVNPNEGRAVDAFSAQQTPIELDAFFWRVQRSVALGDGERVAACVRQASINKPLVADAEVIARHVSLFSWVLWVSFAQVYLSIPEHFSQALALSRSFSASLRNCAHTAVFVL